MARTAGVTYEESGSDQKAQPQQTGTRSPVPPTRLPRQRRTGMLALAVLLVGLGGLVTTFVVSAQSERVSVVVLYVTCRWGPSSNKTM